MKTKRFSEPVEFKSLTEKTEIVRHVLHDDIISMIGRRTKDNCLYDVAIDNSGNIFCAGIVNTGIATAENAGGCDALVVKYDAELNILAKKVYGVDGRYIFDSITVDSIGDVICAGYADVGSGDKDKSKALVVKFNNYLEEVVGEFIYGGDAHYYFNSVTTDKLNNIICAGHANNSDIGSALMVRFDTNLSGVLTERMYRYQGNSLFNAITTDASDNIICAGNVFSKHMDSYHGLVIRLSSDLDVTTDYIHYDNVSQFNALAVDADGNIICAGNSTDYNDIRNSLVVKLNCDISKVLALRECLFVGNDFTHSVAVNADGNIICAGSIFTVVSDSSDALVIELDGNLNVNSKKIYSGVSDSLFYGVAIGQFGRVVCSGMVSGEKIDSMHNISALTISIPPNFSSHISTLPSLESLVRCEDCVRCKELTSNIYYRGCGWYKQKEVRSALAKAVKAPSRELLIKELAKIFNMRLP